jgi:hypothetical protein
LQWSASEPTFHARLARHHRFSRQVDSGVGLFLPLYKESTKEA